MSSMYGVLVSDFSTIKKLIYVEYVQIFLNFYYVPISVIDSGDRAKNEGRLLLLLNYLYLGNKRQ